MGIPGGGIFNRCYFKTMPFHIGMEPFPTGRPAMMPPLAEVGKPTNHNHFF